MECFDSTRRADGGSLRFDFPSCSCRSGASPAEGAEKGSPATIGLACASVRLLRWIAASGYRVTMLIAIAVFVYHVANELRVLFGRPLNFQQRLELTALDVKFAFRGRKPPVKWQ